jgi:hypothetical protein
VKDVWTLLAKGLGKSNEEAGDVPSATLFERSQSDAPGAQFGLEAAAGVQREYRDRVATLMEGPREHHDLTLGTAVRKVVDQKHDVERPRWA